MKRAVELITSGMEIIVLFFVVLLVLSRSVLFSMPGGTIDFILQRSIASDSLKTNHLDSLSFGQLGSLSSDYLFEHPLEEDSPYTEEVLDKIEYFKSNPLDLNKALEADLKELPFVSDMQVLQLILFRHRHNGKLRSIYDLKLIPGWTAELITRLLPLVTFSEDSDGTFKDSLEQQPKGKIQSLLGREFAPPKNYVGDNYSLRQGVIMQLSNKIEAGGLYKKSVGEDWFIRKFLSNPRKVTFFVRFNNLHPNIDLLVLGDYKVSFGAGLICSFGLFTHLDESPSGHIVKNRITRNYSTNEIGWQRGIAVEGSLRSGGLRYMFFVSNRPIDARLGENYLIESINTSGLLRSPKEQRQWHSARMYSIGGRLGYHRPRFYVGINAFLYSFGRYRLSYLPGYKEILPSIPFRYLGNVSVDYTAVSRKGHWRSSGELAIDQGGALAFIHALAWHQTGGFVGALQTRYFSPHYQTFFGNTLSHFSHIGNEVGARLTGSFPIAARWHGNCFIDFFSRIEPTGRQKEKIRGYKVSFFSRYNFSQSWNLTLRTSFTRDNRYGSRRSVKVSNAFLFPNGAFFALYSYRHSRSKQLGSHLLGVRVDCDFPKISPLFLFKTSAALYAFSAPSFSLAQYPYVAHAPFGKAFFPLYGRGILFNGLFQVRKGDCWEVYVQGCRLVAISNQFSASNIPFPNWTAWAQLFFQYKF